MLLSKTDFYQDDDTPHLLDLHQTISRVANHDVIRYFKKESSKTKALFSYIYVLQELPCCYLEDVVLRNLQILVALNEMKVKLAYDE